jgi:prepilin-type N-terminal cleavage/methylation domain-containing protein
MAGENGKNMGLDDFISEWIGARSAVVPWEPNLSHGRLQEGQMRRGLTLIELLTLIAIAAILLCLLYSGYSAIAPNTEVTGTVIDKFSGVDSENYRFYRITVLGDDGDRNEYNSYWIHDKVTQGSRYRLKIRGNMAVDVLQQLPNPKEKE